MILFLLLAILCKSNRQYQYFIQQKIYQESLSFSYFKKFYNKYLGGIFPIEDVSNQQVTSYVFNEELQYQNIERYVDGAKLKVGLNYLIPSMQDGIVVYVGEKAEYGNVVMIENMDGIDIWYGNVCNTLVKLYDQVSSGDYLGEACGGEMYLVYSRGNEFLNYNDYIS